MPNCFAYHPLLYATFQLQHENLSYKKESSKGRYGTEYNQMGTVRMVAENGEINRNIWKNRRETLGKIKDFRN